MKYPLILLHIDETSNSAYTKFLEDLSIGIVPDNCIILNNTLKYKNSSVDLLPVNYTDLNKFLISQSKSLLNIFSKVN